jgi:hypothetical protein
MCECRNCGSDEEIAINDYGICVCEYCVIDEACPELVQRYLDARQRDDESGRAQETERNEQ